MGRLWKPPGKKEVETVSGVRAVGDGKCGSHTITLALNMWYVLTFCGDGLQYKAQN